MRGYDVVQAAYTANTIHTDISTSRILPSSLLVGRSIIKMTTMNIVRNVARARTHNSIDFHETKLPTKKKTKKTFSCAPSAADTELHKHYYTIPQ